MFAADFQASGDTILSVASALETQKEIKLIT
jgi:hypothetical protein